MNRKENQRSVFKQGKRDKSKEDILKDREDEIFNIGREITDTEKTKPDKRLTIKKCNSGIYGYFEPLSNVQYFMYFKTVGECAKILGKYIKLYLRRYW